MIRLGALGGAVLLSFAALVATPTAHAAVPSCTIASAVTSPQAWSLARERLLPLSRGGGFPFGSSEGSPYRRTSAYAWTSGFFPASLWQMYHEQPTPALLASARRMTKSLVPVSRWTGTHDLGFMIGLPMRLAIANDPDPGRRAVYRAALIRAAKSLSTRWNPAVGAVKSADYAGRWGLIIDSAMNAPLLLEAGEMIGGPGGARLQARGTHHMLTLAEHLIRPDGSTIHRMAFDPRTGRPTGPLPGQGLSPSSTWARGQAWAINGFAQAFTLKNDPRLLDGARLTADYWMAHVPAGCSPPWDLQVTEATALRDTSAAAIAVDGILRLSLVETDAARAARYRAYAQVGLTALLDEHWLGSGPSVQGLLQHQAFNVPADPHDGTYVWGDAYLLSAMSVSGQQ